MEKKAVAHFDKFTSLLHAGYFFNFFGGIQSNTDPGRCEKEQRFEEREKKTIKPTSISSMQPTGLFFLLRLHPTVPHLVSTLSVCSVHQSSSSINSTLLMCTLSSFALQKASTACISLQSLSVHEFAPPAFKYSRLLLGQLEGTARYAYFQLLLRNWAST